MARSPITEEVLRAEYRSVYRYALVLCRDETAAQDITQETFLKALSHGHTFAGDSSLYTWLCAIAKHLWLDRRKKQHREVSSEALEEWLPSPDPPLEELLEEKDLSMAIHRVLHRMKDPNTLVIHQNRTFWAKPYQEANEIRWTENIYLIDVAKEDGDYTTLMLNDQVIWTEEANGDGPVPDYVYAYNDFFEDPDAQLVSYSSVLTDRAARAEPVEGFFYDLDRDVIGISYANGDLVTWNLAGELLDGTYPPEN